MANSPLDKFRNDLTALLLRGDKWESAHDEWQSGAAIVRNNFTGEDPYFPGNCVGPRSIRVLAWMCRMVTESPESPPLLRNCWRHFIIHGEPELAHVFEANGFSASPWMNQPSTFCEADLVYLIRELPQIEEIAAPIWFAERNLALCTPLIWSMLKQRRSYPLGVVGASTYGKLLAMAEKRREELCVHN